jgi:hypothetical protein
MKLIALAATLGAGLAALAACQDGGGNDAAKEANDTIDAEGVDASGGVNAGGVGAGTGPAADADADGDLDVDVNLKVPEPKLEVGPDGVTVNAGDDPGVSVTTNGN